MSLAFVSHLLVDKKVLNLLSDQHSDATVSKLLVLVASFQI